MLLLLFIHGSHSIFRQQCDESADYVSQGRLSAPRFIVIDFRKQHENQNSKILKKCGAGNDPKVMSARQKNEDWVLLYLGHETSFVKFVVPERAQRRVVAEMIAAVIRSTELHYAALFVHQIAVSCALDTSLATCSVVDIAN